MTNVPRFDGVVAGCPSGCPNGKGMSNVLFEHNYCQFPSSRSGALRTMSTSGIVIGFMCTRAALHDTEFGLAIAVTQRRTERSHHLKLHRGQVTAAACVRLGPTPTYAKRRRGDQAHRQVDGRDRNLDLAADRAPRVHRSIWKGCCAQRRVPSDGRTSESSRQETLEGANTANDRGVAKVRPHRRRSLVAGRIFLAGPVRRIRATTARALAVAWSPQEQELMRIDDSFCLRAVRLRRGRLDEPSHDVRATARQECIGGGRIAQLFRGSMSRPRRMETQFHASCLTSVARQAEAQEGADPGSHLCLHPKRADIAGSGITPTKTIHGIPSSTSRSDGCAARVSSNRSFSLLKRIRALEAFGTLGVGCVMHWLPRTSSISAAVSGAFADNPSPSRSAHVLALRAPSGQRRSRRETGVHPEEQRSIRGRLTECASSSGARRASSVNLLLFAFATRSGCAPFLAKAAPQYTRRRSGHDSAGALSEKAQEKASALLIHFTDNQYAGNLTNSHHPSTDRAGIRPRQPARARTGAISQGGQGGRSCHVHRGELGLARDGALDDCIEWHCISGATALLVVGFWQRPAVSSQSEWPLVGHAGRSPNATSGQRERSSSSIARLVATFQPSTARSPSAAPRNPRTRGVA
jgi:hypothetical protein